MTAAGEAVAVLAHGGTAGLVVEVLFVAVPVVFLGWLAWQARKGAGAEADGEDDPDDPGS